MPTDSHLAGSTWSIRAVRIDDALVPVVGSKPATLAFDEDGRFSGCTGCNNFFGRFTETQGDLMVSPVGSTLMMCPDEVMVQERTIFAALESTRSIDLDDQRLLLLDVEGTVLLDARRSAPGV